MSKQTPSRWLLTPTPPLQQPQPQPQPQTQTQVQVQAQPQPPAQRRYTYYHAGPLFTLADLHTNTLLSNKIHELTHGFITPLVPQNIEHRPTNPGEVPSPHAIRDQDIRGLLSCDLALFVYDGAELDSGTVVEYMLAKFADIPAVILRTDFRNAGDQGAGKGAGDAWNLMSSFWPRTRVVNVDSMGGYKSELGEVGSESGRDGREVARMAGDKLIEVTAKRVVNAMEEVVQMGSVMPKEAREHVYRWLAVMPEFKEGSEEENVRGMLELLKGKEGKGLM